jgi:hypothetical protein
MIQFPPKDVNSRSQKELPLRGRSLAGPGLRLHDPRACRSGFDPAFRLARRRQLRSARDSAPAPFRLFLPIFSSFLAAAASSPCMPCQPAFKAYSSAAPHLSAPNCRSSWQRTCISGCTKGFNAMIDFLLGLAYVAIVLTPAIVASVQLPKSHSGDL